MTLTCLVCRFNTDNFLLAVAAIRCVSLLMTKPIDDRSVSDNCSLIMIVSGADDMGCVYPGLGGDRLGSKSTEKLVRQKNEAAVAIRGWI